MQIMSREPNSWIRIERQSDLGNGYAAFTFEASIDIDHGSFLGRNSDVQFLNNEEFLHELDLFMPDRSFKPCLKGTYDSFLHIHGSASIVTVDFTIGDTFCGTNTHNFICSGPLVMDQEQFSRVIEEVKSFQQEAQ